LFNDYNYFPANLGERPLSVLLLVVVKVGNNYNNITLSLRCDFLTLGFTVGLGGLLLITSLHALVVIAMECCCLWFTVVNAA